MSKIKQVFTNIFNRMKQRPLLHGIIIGALLVGASFVFGGKKDDNSNLLVVKRGEFIKQVSVSGKVVAAQNVELGFDQSGRVQAVYANVGKTVGAGAVLASVENGDLRADLLQKQASLETAKANLESLRKGTRSEQLAVTKSNVTSATLSLSQANEALLNAIKDGYTKSDDAVRGKVDLFISNPKSSNPQLQFTSSDSQVVIRLLEERIKVENALQNWQVDISNSSSNNELTQLIVKSQNSLNLVSSLLDFGSQALNLTTAGSAISETNLNTHKSNILTARTNVNSVNQALTSAITAQKSAASSLLTAQNNLRLEEAGATSEDIEAEVAKVKAAEAGILNAEARLRKSLVIAPFSGVITKMDAKVGEVASPGTSKISMISADSFQIESYVPEVEIAYLKVGNESEVTLDAYGEAVDFKAVVISIDPAETIRDGVSMYKTKLQFSAADERIKSGMTANVTITTEKKEGVISVPQGLVTEKNGKSFISVLEGNEAVEREVQTGLISSSGQIEITSGLEEGDIVIVTLPTN